MKGYLRHLMETLITIWSARASKKTQEKESVWRKREGEINEKFSMGFLGDQSSTRWKHLS
jgi:hypothetical protein